MKLTGWLFLCAFSGLESVKKALENEFSLIQFFYLHYIHWAFWAF